MILRLQYNLLLLMLRTLEKTSDNHEERQLLSSQLPIFLMQSVDKNDISVSEVQQCRQLIESIANCQETLHNKIEKIKEKVQERTYNKGLGYFNAKNLIFLEYLIQLEFYELFKINAVDLTKGPGLELYRRLVYLKTLLMKLSPIQKKLEYQKNKMLKLSDLVNVKSDNPQKDETNGQLGEVQEQEDEEGDDEEEEDARQQQESGEDDALAYQPRPQSLIAVKQKKEALIAKEGKYIAPKISATLSKQDKLRRRQELQEERRKAHLIRRYRDDLIDDDEAREEGVQNEVAEKIKRKFKEKTSIQEDNFVRFPQTKKDKFWKKQLIQKFNKTDHLRDTLKEVEMVGQIYRTQVQEEQKLDSIYSKNKEKSKSGFKSGKTGTKKQKNE